MIMSSYISFEEYELYKLKKYAINILGFILFFPAMGFAQMQQGGLQGTSKMLLTPDQDFNQSIEAMDIRTVDVFGFDDSDGLKITPQFDDGWTWLAAFNVPYRDETMNWFMYDGWLYTTESMNTNMRRRGFHEDITNRITSNAYHMAFYYEKVVEREIVMLIVSPEDQIVQFELDESFFGKEELIEYEMSAGEAKFVHIIIPPEERTKVTWQKYDNPRKKLVLESKWKYHKGEEEQASRSEFDDSGWESITIPHSWNSRDVYDQRNIKDDLDIMEMYYRGVGWYRKTFEIDSEWDDKRIELAFLGANQVTDVWLNGEYLGKNIGGYLGFDFEVTDIVNRDGENTLAVKVDSKFDYDIPPHTADYNFYGGLYREVILKGTSPTHLSKTYTEGLEVSHESARAVVRHHLKNKSDQSFKGYKLVTNLLNPYGEIIQTLTETVDLPANSSQEIEITSDILSFPMLWSPDDPNLYEVYSILKDTKGNVADLNREPLGFRWYIFDSDNGFILNGEPLKLKGVNFHQDYLNKGNEVSLEQKREDLEHIKKMGANFVRLAHYPHHPAVMDMTDELGLLAWSEIPWVNTTGGDAFAENAKNMMQTMIERDFNHPSVILWGIGNEFAMGFIDDASLQRAKTLAQSLHNLSKELDPNRLTVQAHNEVIDVELMEITDVQGRNRYFGWYEATYNDFAAALDEEKELYPSWNILISEYGAEGKYGYHVIDPEIFDHSETYQMNFHRAHWEAIHERNWVSGGALWNMFDFGSHVKIGNIPHINQKGMMTKDRIPKSVYRYYQSQWLEEPVLYIVSHTQHHKPVLDDGTTDVTVFSNCSEIELKVNGESQDVISGKKVFNWNIIPETGLHHLEAIGKCNGNTVSEKHSIYYYED